MKARGIPFTAEMVLAIRDGRKTQTRRRLKYDGPTPDRWLYHDGLWWPCADELQRGAMDPIAPGIKCPYGEPGDRLYVRERLILAANYTVPTHGGLAFEDRAEVVYAADREPAPVDHWPWQRWSLPSIHMPRDLARYWLEVVRVDVQRPCDISEEDAIAEGAPLGQATDGSESRALGFMDLLLSLHPKDPGIWTRPCWVVEFRRIDGGAP